MNKILAVRHAESIANTLGIYQGQTYDTNLSPLGKKQAKALAKRLSDEKIDRIIASPLKRTMQTAQTVAKAIGLKVGKEEAIIETNHGDWEGKSKDWIENNYPEVWKAWQEKPAEAVFPNGEAFLDTDKRVDQFIMKHEWKGTTVLVTHDNIVRLMVCLAKKDSINNIWNYVIEPAAICRFEMKEINGEKNLSVTKLNNTNYLKGLHADISKHAL